MRGVELLVILAVTAFHLAIMSGRIRANQLVANPETRQLLLKQRGCISSLWQKALCKFCAVVCLNAFNGVGKSLNHVPEEHSGGIGAVLFKCLKIPKTAVLIKEGVLEPLRSLLLTNHAD